MENVKNNEYEVRKEKLNKLKEEIIVYKDKYDDIEKLENVSTLNDGTYIKVAGRIVSKRSFGKFMFLNLYDVNGTAQISISKQDLGNKYDFFKKDIDLGDFIGVAGEIYTTNTGVKTVKVLDGDLLSKSLRSLPEKFHGLTDSDIKYRQRYLGIISNDITRTTFKKRIQILNDIKDYLRSNDFIEVETPILQNVASGANAKPFITKHNALNENYYLRIAPELYLKQVVESGFNKVFELGKNFRNEGMDASHLQEFTMLEWYAAYWDYLKNMDFLEKLLKDVITDVNGNLDVEYQGKILNFNNFEKINYSKTISDLLNINILDFKNVDEVKKIFIDNQMFDEAEINNIKSVTAAVNLVFKKKVRPYLIQPTILYGYPAYMIPLARRNDKDDRIIDMFQLVVNGWELSKCYSELIDPEIQRRTFEQQMIDKNNGDEESMSIDEDFILAMEHGMPPMSGLGLGIDRVVSILTNEPTLRDVILFPQMKKNTQQNNQNILKRKKY